ncbi:Flagellin [Candidatus Magnetaquicoccaceae bacterium FCR-1]|uniref:Flagellin n=1 Tax=Candidatus Magnetaquiglobus chichijimensis TaxID=3141448 RepID=A0ABQ0CD39_9PROT
MSLSISTNLFAINAQRNLMRSTNALGTTYKRLSSGLRINSAKDDAAGMSISTRMTAQIRGLNQAVRNANDGISMMQVAEGALDETTNALQRIRELSVEAANDTMNPTDRLALQKEIDQLLSEIDRIATQTEFNNQVLLSGGWETNKVFQVGADQNQTILVNVDRTTTTSLLSMTAVGAAGAINVSTQASANATLARLDRALDSVSDIRASLGAYQNRFEMVIANLSNVVENTSAARSRIVDADIAAESADLTRNAILQQAGTAVLAQANQQPQIALQLLGK